jgi:hypothetical protein
MFHKINDTLNALIMSQITINSPQRTLRHLSYFHVSTYYAILYNVSKNSFILRANSLCNEMHVNVFKDSHKVI